MVWPLSLEPRRLGLAGVVRPQTCHADRLLTAQGKDGAPLQTVFGHAGARAGETPRRRGSVAQPRRSAHAHTALSVHRHRPHDRARVHGAAIGHPMVKR